VATGAEKEMTEQYLQKTINREGFRRVDQGDIDATLTTPAVVLGPDDKFVELGDNGGAAYQVNMPNVGDCSGVQFTLKALPTNAVAVTIASVEIGAVNPQTFDFAVSPLAPAMAAGFSTILQGSTPAPPVPPAIVGAVATDWKVIKAPAAP